MFEISVIVPTHNRAHVLPRALDSILAQTRPVSEIIVIDDGSSDGTVKLIQQDYPQVNLLTQSQQGVSAARNTGIKQARHDWLALLDSDDEWLPQKIEKQIELLQQNPNDRICHTEEIWIRNGKRVNAMNKHKKYGGWIYPYCLPLCAMSPSSIVFHRSVLEQTGLFDEELPACEDYDLWLKMCSRFPVLFVETPCINKYGGHDDQLSQKYWGMDRFRIQALQRMLDSDFLSDDYRQQTQEMLQQKIKIFILGAEKRGKAQEVEQYRQLLQAYGLQS